jgi:hypothetical protein
MPIQIRISVNENVAETFHVGRLTRNGLSADSVNEYAVVNQHSEPTNAEWDAAPRFTHRYGDDINTIVLEAINRHQKHVTEQDGAIGAQSVPTLPVNRTATDTRNAHRLCGYTSTRMQGACRLPYGHKLGHKS